MARRIPLRTVTVVNGSGGPMPFSWAEMIQVILKTASPQRGMTMDEVLACVDAMKPLEKAMDEGAEFVTYSEAQYKILREKLDTFQFALADSAVAEFGLAIREAPEIT